MSGLEGIDTLETHFEDQHQDLTYADAARDRMLDLMGFGQVEFWDDLPNKTKTAEHHPIRGYLLANGIESNGRVLGLVYPGNPDLPATTVTTDVGGDSGPAGGHRAGDGDPVFVTEQLLDHSLNAALVRNGIAYAELYATMPLDLIRHMRGLIAQARSEKLGMWRSEDLTTSSRTALHDLAQLSTLTMFPKLYRRLVKYFKDPRHTDLAAFDTWIRDDPIHRDDTLLLPTGEFGNLHDLYDVNTDGITLRHQPEDVTFAPDPPVQ
ncbi:hypothetical protein [Pseudonocardia adelaidensis]|uniref:Nuclease n=1 Tax=Pseudonocardia adelaidensis TaxID=648754 RepID=A0ABP9P6L4_9PSEU